MTRSNEIPHERYGVAYLEVSPQACPRGHKRLRPGWDGCRVRAHRYWMCLDDACRFEIVDPDCGCQADNPDAWVYVGEPTGKPSRPTRWRIVPPPVVTDDPARAAAG